MKTKTERLLDAVHLLMANTCIYPWCDHYLTPPEHVKEFSQAFYAWKRDLEKGIITIEEPKADA